MDRSNKLYMKAVNYYNEGYIEKALEYCEKSISENINNTAAINLKGLLYYLKGELGNAQALWKMNYQMNKDLVSKKYLEDSANDEEKKHSYKAALKAIKELKIKAALNFLMKCRESDFNSINVNNYMALCYIKLGEYEKALKAIDQVLKIDKNNKAALNHKKELQHFGVLKKSFSYKMLGLVMIAAVIFVSGILLYRGKLDGNITLGNNQKAISDKEAAKEEQVKLQPEPVNEPQQEEKKFPKEDIAAAFEEKDYEKLHEFIVNYEASAQSEEEKNLVIKSKELLSRDGMEYFYAKGLEALNEKDYNSAIGYFNKGYNYSEGSYKHSHYIYMLGLSCKNAGDIDNAIKYYKEYDSKYPSGDYEQTVLYELVLIYKNIDNSICKEYAERLVKLYPKSIYNNSIIQGILSR